jgi:predicted hotdog family 3-hydroxylacyl-ACP dehydratase
MAQDGQLDAVCGLEYACQAMATHAALLAQSESRVGYVAVVRDMICNAGRLDDLTDDLDISAERVMGEASRVIYRFAVHHRGDAIVCGRAAVVLA